VTPKAFAIICPFVRTALGLERPGKRTGGSGRGRGWKIAESRTPPENPGRRRFLKFGLAGTGMVFLAGLWRHAARAAQRAPAGFRFLTTQDRRIFAALAPRLLGEALPRDGRESRIAEILAAVDQLAAAMPPVMQADLRQLFDLLGFPPTRIALAGVWSGWETVSEQEVDAFLDRWSTSTFTLLQLAYAALHDLVMAAWYDSPHAWARVGYDGPPDIPDAVRKAV